MLLEHAIPEIMQGIQIRREYCIRQSRNFPKLEKLELTSLSQPKNGLKEICATKVLLNA